MILGVVAWIVSYYLAAISMGNGSPSWLVPGIVVFGVLYCGVCLYSLTLERQAEYRGVIWNLEGDAYSLANGLRDLINDIPLAIEGTLIAPGVYKSFDESALKKARERRCANIVAEYESRFATRVGNLARELRKHNVPQTDVFFDLVSEGPNDDEDTFQIATGLERLARHLRT